MVEIITYMPGAYCQLKLASGEHILIRCCDQTGIKIMKLSLDGLLPTKTIADWPISRIATAIHSFADENAPSQHPLETIKNKLITCSSIRDVEQTVLSADKGPYSDL